MQSTTIQSRWSSHEHHFCQINTTKVWPMPSSGLYWLKLHSLCVPMTRNIRIRVKYYGFVFPQRWKYSAKRLHIDNYWLLGSLFSKSLSLSHPWSGFSNTRVVCSFCDDKLIFNNALKTAYFDGLSGLSDNWIWYLMFRSMRELQIGIVVIGVPSINELHFYCR
jgi:hypothetical protein